MFAPTRILFYGGILYGISPIIVTLAASLVASSLGCELNEGGPESCAILGFDISELLYAGGLMFLYAFYTLPLGFMMMVAGAVLGIWQRIRPAKATEQR